jgi:ABC-type Fe3+-hydroxamate transport system substrate-binding protein
MSKSRLNRLFAADGKCFDVAIDHGFFNELSFLSGIEDIRKAIETVVAAAPDIIILADSLYGVTPDMVANRAGWEGIPAVKNQSVFPIDDNLVSRPGPRIVAGLAAVIAIIEEVLVEVKY